MSKKNSTVEEWRPIPGWVGTHEASSQGRIRSLDRRVLKGRGRMAHHQLRGRVLRQSPRPNGYLSVSMNARRVSVHSLVAAAFYGARPTGHVCCHNDGDKANTRATNLRYDSPAGNSADMVRHGRSQRGSKNRTNTLSESDVVHIFRRVHAGECAAVLAEEFGTSKPNVYNIKNGASWGWLTAPEVLPTS